MPDMKTALTTALTGTGLKPKSQTERIWNWLKDHPDQTSRRLQTELKIPQSSISSLLTKMVKRSMLTRKTETDRFGVRLTYRISPSMKEFELLPAPKTPQPKKPSAASAELPVRMHCTEEKPIPVPIIDVQEAQLPQSPTELVDSLTVAKARELYNILHKLFG